MDFEMSNEQFEELKTKPLNEDDDVEEAGDIWTEIDARNFPNMVSGLYSRVRPLYRSLSHTDKRFCFDKHLN